MEITSVPKIEAGGQILFDRPNSLIVCNIVEVREKAIKVDYAIEPISMYGGNAVVVYTHTCFIPKSVITGSEEKGLTVKKWFSNQWTGGVHIKKYFTKEGKQIFI